MLSFEQKLRAKFPNAPESFIQRQIKDSNHEPIHNRNRGSAELQKYQANNSAKKPARNVDYRAAQKSMDGSGVGTFRMSITLLYSSQRDSDLDGGATTLCDCLIAAIGRLAQVDSGTQRKLAACLKRV